MKKTKHVTVALEEATYQTLKQQAAAEARSISGQCRQIIRRHLAAQKPEEIGPKGNATQTKHRMV